MNKLFTFNDITLIPEYSTIRSRTSVDTSVILSNKINLKIPIISANMDCVTDANMAIAMNRYGGMGILHRFYQNEDDRLLDIEKYYNTIGRVPVFTIGVSDEDKLFCFKIFDKYPASKIDAICVDIAHGHSVLMKETIKWLRRIYNNTIIAGNVCTISGAYDLVNWGANIIKVGVGNGSACSTRKTTGMGVPQAYAINSICHEFRKNNINIDVIADGGITGSDDLCKALALGAKSVMIGKLLAACDESAASYKMNRVDMPVHCGNIREIHTIEIPDKKYKIYRGQSSHEIQKEMGTYRPEIAAEGESYPISATGPLENTLNRLVGGLRSSMAYDNASNLKEYKPKWQLITSNSYIEGTVHGKNN